MKFRTTFVTNSSSSSYIICFARIADREKAQKILDKEGLDVFNVEDIRQEMYYGELGADWAGATIWDADEILKNYSDGEFILIEGGFEIYEPWDGEPDYDVDYCDFYEAKTINQITKENGFDNIEIAYGAGRNG